MGLIDLYYLIIYIGDVMDMGKWGNFSNLMVKDMKEDDVIIVHTVGKYPQIVELTNDKGTIYITSRVKGD